MYPRLKVRSQDDSDTDGEDSNSNISDESTIKCLSPEGHQSLKSPVKRGNNFENRPLTSCSTPSKWFSKSHPVSFTSTLFTTAEKAGNNIGDKVDRPNSFVRPRAVVSSQENDDLIALQNRRIEKKTPRVKKCYINPPPNKNESNENKILNSVAVPVKHSPAQIPSACKRNGEIRPVTVLTTKSPSQVPSTAKKKEESRPIPVSAAKVIKPPAQVPSTAKRKEKSGTRGTIATLARPN